MKFVKESVIDAPAERVFAFHEQPDAFEQLQPPWQTHELVKPPTSLEVGTEVILKVKVGPVWQTIVARHVEYEPGVLFVDEMVKGPFRRWVHRHVVTPEGPGRARLTDDIEYELPLGGLGRLVGGPIARRNLEKLFDYRHAVTRRVCES